MSDTRALAQQITDIIQREADPHLIDNYRENLEKAAQAILAEFLVVPRSDIVGTEYALEPYPGAPLELYSDRAVVIDVGERCGLRALERPDLAWSVIPLPEEADR